MSTSIPDTDVDAPSVGVPAPDPVAVADMATVVVETTADGETVIDLRSAPAEPAAAEPAAAEPAAAEPAAALPEPAVVRPRAPRRRRRSAEERARRAVLRDPGRVEFYVRSPIGWQWIVKSTSGRVLADSALGRPRRSDAEFDATDVLEALLHSELPSVRLTVARYLAGLPADLRDSILTNAHEIAELERGHVTNGGVAIRGGRRTPSPMTDDAAIDDAATD